MICIASIIQSIKIMWSKRLLNNIDAKWKKVSKTFLGIDVNFSLVSIPSVSFYAQALKIWYDFLNFHHWLNLMY